MRNSESAAICEMKPFLVCRKQVNQEQRSSVALKRAELQASALQKEQEQAILMRHLARQQAIEQRMKDVALKRVLLLQQHQKEACTSPPCPVFKL